MWKYICMINDGIITAMPYIIEIASSLLWLEFVQLIDFVIFRGKGTPFADDIGVHFLA